MLRTILLSLLLIGGATVAQEAPPAAPAAVPVKIALSVQDQSDLRSICVLAVRSPALTDTDSVLLVGAFCAKLRDAMVEANKQATPADKPKE